MRSFCPRLPLGNLTCVRRRILLQACWAKDPLKLKPLLIKGYSELSAKVNFIIVSSLLRFGANAEAFPFVSSVDTSVYEATLMFTTLEIVFWIAMLYSVEMLRKALRKAPSPK